MKEPISSSPPPEAFRVVEDPRQAQLLSDGEALRYFEPFLARETTASAAARELGVRIDTLLYRMRKFREAGLLRVTRVEPRAGRAVKHYRSDADAYFVPFHATPYADLEERFREPLVELARRTATLLARSHRQLGVHGRRIYRHADGEVWQDTSDAPRRSFEPTDPALPPAEALSGHLRLERPQAKAMLQELWALWSRYHGLQSEAGHNYLVALTLLRDDEER